MPTFSTHLRLYCERSGDGLFAEPLNAVTSLGFFITAWLLYREYRKYRRTETAASEIPVLIFMTACIGAGSLAFHMLATRGSVFFDVVPIVFFVCFYAYVFARIILGLNVLMSSLLFILLIVVNLLYKFYVFRAIDGYVSYLPTFLFYLLLTLPMLVRKHPSALRVAFATLLGFLSLYFRTTDRPWCEDFPIGTHFLWHLFNAVIAYMLVRELMVARAVASASSHK